jgi:hypothetical protein
VVGGQKAAFESVVSRTDHAMGVYFRLSIVDRLESNGGSFGRFVDVYRIKIDSAPCG